MRGLTVFCALFSVPVPVPAAAAQALVRAVVLTSVGHLLRGDGAAGDAEPAESDAQMRKVIRAQQLYVRSNRTTKAVQAAIEASEAKANQAEADQAQTKAAVDEAPGASQETPEAAADEAGTPDTPDAADTTETDDAGKEDATTATTATTAEEAGVHAREGARKLLACLSMLPACYPHTSIPARSGHTHTRAHTRTRTRAHTGTQAHMHTHAHTHVRLQWATTAWRKLVFTGGLVDCAWKRSAAVDNIALNAAVFFFFCVCVAPASSSRPARASTRDTTRSRGWPTRWAASRARGVTRTSAGGAWLVAPHPHTTPPHCPLLAPRLGPRALGPRLETGPFVIPIASAALLRAGLHLDRGLVQESSALHALHALLQLRHGWPWCCAPPPTRTAH